MKEIVSVTVIIPCYKCSDVLGRAVKSVYCQSVLPCELILVDDFSNDSEKTIKKMKELEELYNKKCDCNWIKCIYLKKNSGPGIARNEAWNIANGDYIAFLDADDAWHNRKIEIQYEYMKNNGSVVISSHLSRTVDQVQSESDLVNARSVKTISFHSLFLKNYFKTRTVMLKRALPNRFEPLYRGEDYLLWFHILSDSQNKASLINCYLAYDFAEERNHLTSSNQLAHEGEIDALNYILRDNLINRFQYLLIRFWWAIKNFRRIIKKNVWMSR